MSARAEDFVLSEFPTFLCKQTVGACLRYHFANKRAQAPHICMSKETAYMQSCIPKYIVGERMQERICFHALHASLNARLGSLILAQQVARKL